MSNTDLEHRLDELGEMLDDICAMTKNMILRVRREVSDIEAICQKADELKFWNDTHDIADELGLIIHELKEQEEATE